MPPLNSLQIIPVPPPTFPSSTGPGVSGVECVPGVFRLYVKTVDVVQITVPGLGHDRQGPPVALHVGRSALDLPGITASRTTPTLCVLVIIMGPLRNPESSTHVVPVISPLPFSVNHAANTASLDAFPRGWIAVTPVRTGPFPISSFPSPEISVVWPTSTPFTSVMALFGPGVPSKGRRDRERGAWFPQRAVSRQSKTAQAAMLYCEFASGTSSPPAKQAV